MLSVTLDTAHVTHCVCRHFHRHFCMKYHLQHRMLLQFITALPIILPRPHLKLALLRLAPSTLLPLTAILPMITLTLVLASLCLTMRLTTLLLVQLTTIPVPQMPSSTSRRCACFLSLTLLRLIPSYHSLCMSTEPSFSYIVDVRPNLIVLFAKIV